MQILDSYPRAKSISGFVYQKNLVEVLNIYNSAPSMTPPQIIKPSRASPYGDFGHYVGLCMVASDEKIQKLSGLMKEMMIDGEEYAST